MDFLSSPCPVGSLWSGGLHGGGDIAMDSSILSLFTIPLVTDKVMVLPGVDMELWEETAGSMYLEVQHLKVSYHPWHISCQHN